MTASLKMRLTTRLEPIPMADKIANSFWRSRICSELSACYTDKSYKNENDSKELSHDFIDFYGNPAIGSDFTPCQKNIAGC